MDVTVLTLRVLIICIIQLVYIISQLLDVQTLTQSETKKFIIGIIMAQMQVFLSHYVPNV